MHNAKLGRSPYTNVDNNGKVKNVNTKINNKDYCKEHIKILKEELGGVLSERK